MSGSSKNTECEPLKSLEDVLCWKSETDWSVLVTFLKSRSKYCYEGSSFSCHKRLRKPVKILNSSAPKTLLCHDMKGGYLDDRFIDGSLYKYQYLFYHWSAIDIFIYFSHYFVTIPPLMWINAAHSHGVQILGTIITEFDDGEKIWNVLLNNDDDMDAFIAKLVEICSHYQFDGYLLNIENKIATRLIPKLISFLKKLKSLLNSKLVIWYDSVSLLSGELKWQNELNEHNKTAFEICDGIFLNYGWKDSNLENSLSRAGARQYDVYVGIDVFGRGCFGGGGFNTDKAMHAVRSYALSIALFGFGWTHETQADDSNFFAIERKFWIKLWPYLYIHIPNSLPFKTTFNQGVGAQLLKVQSPQTVLWYNLSFQGYQLTMPSCLSTIPEKCCINQYFEDGFSRGCSIMLNKEKSEIEIHRLLLCDFFCTESNPLKLTIVSKWPCVYSPFKLILWVENDVRNYTIILQISKENETAPQDFYDYSCPTKLAKTVSSTKSIKICDNDWISNEFVLEFEGKITEIDAKVEEPTLIGLVSLE